MLDTFVKALVKQHELGQQSDTRFKTEAWRAIIAGVQSVYMGKEVIPQEKLKSKLDHVHI